MNRPEPTECAAYYLNYIRQVPEGDIIEILEKQLKETMLLLQSISEEKAELPMRSRQMEY